MVGALLGTAWIADASHASLATFQAFVSGMLLHVAFHSHEHGGGDACGGACCGDQKSFTEWRWAELAGAVLGVGVVFLAPLLAPVLTARRELVVDDLSEPIPHLGVVGLEHFEHQITAVHLRDGGCHGGRASAR